MTNTGTSIDNDVALAYAKMWGSYNPDEFLAFLAEDVTYNSQWVFDEINGKQKFTDYIQGKLATIQKTEAHVKAVLGVARDFNPGQTCVMLFQSNHDTPDAVVLFTVQDNQVTEIDLCIPELFVPIAKEPDHAGLELALS